MNTPRAWPGVAAALAATMLVAGCAESVSDPDTASTASPSEAVPQADDSPSSTTSSTSPSSVGSPSASSSDAAFVVPTPTAPVQQVEIDGAIVTTRSALDVVPEQASVVRFSSTLIDDGGGFELCLEGVMESLPPQCDGPVVVSLDPQGWTETQSGVTWGDREIVVAWPPDDGELVLIEDGPPRPPPEEPIDEPDGSYGEAALMAIQDQLSNANLYGASGPVLYTAIGATPGRLDVGVVVADLATVRRVLEVVDTPDALHVWGHGEILAG